MTVKGCVHYFYFYHQNKTFKKLWKMLFVLLKKLLLSSRFSNFCISLFFLGKCWFFGRTWLMINSKLVVYYMEKIAMEKFGCLKVNFCLPQWQGDSLAYSMLITALFLIRSINYLESWIEIGSKSLAKHIIRIWT